MSKLPTKEGLMKWVDDYAHEHGLEARETLFLTKFAAYADASMGSWALVSTLARQSRSSERKVQYMLRDFEAAGVIQRTGRLHRIEGTSRDVPIYVFAAYVDSLKTEPAMGARGAPIRADGCTESGAMGAQGVRPHKNSGIQSPSDEGDTRARQREALFVRLEEAFPKRALGFTIPAAARSAFGKLLDEGIDAEQLIKAAASFAADKAGKRSEQGLHFWLEDRKYRGWWPESQLAFEDAKPVATASPHAAPAEDQAVWRVVRDQLAASMSEGEFRSWVQPTFLALRGDQLFVVAATGTARDWIERRCWRRVERAWDEIDRAGRRLQLVSKITFEASAARQTVGV